MVVAYYLMGCQDTERLLKDKNKQIRFEEFRTHIRAQRKKYWDKITRYTIQQLHPKTNKQDNKSQTETQGDKCNETEEDEHLHHKKNGKGTSTQTSETKARVHGSNTDTPTKTGQASHPASPSTPVKKLKLKETDKD